MIPINKKQKKKIIEQLNDQYGITELPYEILKFGKEKLRIFSGNYENLDLNILDKALRIENIGLYFAKYERDEIRLTLDGVQILKNQISKNIVEINEKESQEWLKGYDLQTKAQKTWVVIKHNNELLGCGKSTGEKITNFVPKERRIKN
ncbi:hypothetical protein GOV12_06045 [Candidatus Pacearchaeota archaeon]|nr:hypothetical protein [Candidatus Pacearchaeota archaeon]